MALFARIKRFFGGRLVWKKVVHLPSRLGAYKGLDEQRSGASSSIDHAFTVYHEMRIDARKFFEESWGFIKSECFVKPQPHFARLLSDKIIQT
jgi:hypothetical protein